MVRRMTEAENLILERLRRIGDDVTDMRREMRSLTTRVGILETRFCQVEMQMATMSVRLDHMNERLDHANERLDRIERRLELRDGPAE